MKIVAHSSLRGRLKPAAGRRRPRSTVCDRINAVPTRYSVGVYRGTNGWTMRTRTGGTNRGCHSAHDKKPKAAQRAWTDSDFENGIKNGSENYFSQTETAMSDSLFGPFDAVSDC